MKTLVSIPKYATAYVGILFLCFCSNSYAQVIFSEDFSGSSDVEGSLNGTAEDAQGAIWSANGFATESGELATGQFEGSALLPFDPVPDNIYTLTVDVTTGSDRWFGVGFSNGGSSEALNSAQDRLAQSGGIGWFLLRPATANLVQQVEVFGGFNTSNIINDNNLSFAGPTVARTMQIVLDTSVDSTGATFDLDCLIDGASINFGPQTVPVLVDDINFVGFTFEGPATAGDPFGPPITITNFVLEVESMGGLLGDVNCDDVVDLLDIAPFVDLITSGGFSPKADINGDLVVDLLDIAGFVDLILG